MLQRALPVGGGPPPTSRSLRPGSARPGAPVPPPGKPGAGRRREGRLPDRAAGRGRGARSHRRDTDSPEGSRPAGAPASSRGSAGRGRAGPGRPAPRRETDSPEGSRPARAPASSRGSSGRGRAGPGAPGLTAGHRFTGGVEAGESAGVFAGLGRARSGGAGASGPTAGKPIHRRGRGRRERWRLRGARQDAAGRARVRMTAALGPGPSRAEARAARSEGRRTPGAARGRRARVPVRGPGSPPGGAFREKVGGGREGSRPAGRAGAPRTGGPVASRRSGSDRGPSPPSASRSGSPRPGWASRRAVDQWVAEGRVRVNGRVAAAGTRVRSGDRVRIDGRQGLRAARRDVPVAPLPQARPARWRHAATPRAGGRSSRELAPPSLRALGLGRPARHQHLGPVALRYPTASSPTGSCTRANRLEREYAVRVLGRVDEETIRHLQRGVDLDDGPARFLSIEAEGGEGANRWYLGSCWRRGATARSIACGSRRGCGSAGSSESDSDQSGSPRSFAPARSWTSPPASAPLSFETVDLEDPGPPAAVRRRALPRDR